LLGQALSRIGQPEPALVCIREALRLARERQDLFYTALALRELGILLLDLGQTAEARRFLEESLAGEPRPRAAIGTMAYFIGLALAEGDGVRAVRLAAAVVALSEAWPDRLAPEPFNRAEVYLKAAGEALGPAARQAAQAEGAAMSLAQAVDYALRRGPGDGGVREPHGVLTARELEVVQLVAAGQTNRQIAATLVIAERTAHRHIENILSKLGLSNRAQIAAWAVERRLGETPRP
jgi:DNA-binding CsgD family transcriptional regulator